MDHSDIATSTSTKKTYIVPQRFTCRFNNLIYLITCMKCKSQYVSQTKNSIMDRLQQHLKDIDHCKNCDNAPPSAKAKGPTNMGLHFNRSRHRVDDVQVQVLELIQAHPDSQDARTLCESREIHWMYQLKSLAPLGINATDGSNHTRWFGATYQLIKSQSTQSQTNFTN